MTRWTYLSYCLEHSFRGSIAVAQVAAILALIIGGTTASFVPSLDNTVAMLLWLIPLLAFVAFFAIGWAFAPYHLVVETVGKLEKAGGELSSERDQLRTQAQGFDDRVAAIEEKHEYRLRELASENESLKSQLSKLEESRSRVEHVRQQLLKLVDEVPREDGYTSHKGWEWVRRVDIILNGSLNTSACSKFRKTVGSYSGLQEAVASLRLLAANLCVSDLLRK